MADLHQPLHAGEPKIKGNTIKLKFLVETQICTEYDSDLINDYGMSYSELAKSLMERKNDPVAIGNPVAWANESQEKVLISTAKLMKEIA